MIWTFWIPYLLIYPDFPDFLSSIGDNNPNWEYYFLFVWQCLYYDSSQDIQWNIAWALWESIRLCPRDIPRAQAIFHNTDTMDLTLSVVQL